MCIQADTFPFMCYHMYIIYNFNLCLFLRFFYYCGEGGGGGGGIAVCIFCVSHVVNS